jgi:signal transduction histidine kinase
MWSRADSSADLYREYRNELRVQRMPEAVGRACAVVFVLNMAFVALDMYAYPEQFSSFLTARLALNAALAAIYFWGSHRYPELSQNSLCLATGSLLLWVVYGAGAPMEDYYVGLVLAAVGLPVLLPMNPRRAALIWSLLVAGYAVSPLFAEAAAFTWKTYAIHTLFLASGAFTGVASTAYMDSARLRDFAQRRELESARDHLKELDKVKSRFTANVHHELRTPLTLTLAPLEGILSGEFGEVPPALRGYLKTMHVNALRLLKLINNLLDLAKVEGQQMQLHRRAADLPELVSDIVEGARPLADRKGIELTTRVATTLPTVYVDPDAIEKVVVNLVGNALKFTDEGGRIEASIERKDMGVELVVSDTGIGLPEDQLERVFDRFAQVDGSSTRKHEGTGIGLSLVKELVELHGGRVWAESDGPGQGTRMCVVLPAGQSDATEAEEVIEQDDGSAITAGRSLEALAADFALANRDDAPHSEADPQTQSDDASEPACHEVSTAPPDAPEILVVEDNPDMRRLFESLLSNRYRVRLTTNGREALEAIHERAPDLVLTDVMMPEMSGTELCRAVKQDPQTQTIPVVLVTSKAERQMKIEGLELGADDYVAKPFHPRELMARVDALMRLHSLQVELAERNERLSATLAELQATQDQLIESERLAAVGELAAGVAHEANNPINFALNAARAMGGRAKDVREVALRLAELDSSNAETLLAQAEALGKLQEQLELGEVVGDLDELIEIVTEGLERTGRLVSDLQNFGRAQHKQRMPVDVRQHLISTLSLLRSKLHDESVDVVTTFAEDLPEVLGNAGALDQVFLNLFKNAIDAIGGRGGRIEVEGRGVGDNVVIEVRDDGPGLSESDQERFFAPFVSTKRAGRGTGLGLSISRRIIREHGGTIELVPGEERGAVARIVLPVKGGAGGDEVVA